jgi:hypothetical protein
MKRPPITFKRIVKGSFNDQKYLDAYRQRGEFPSIHNQVATVLERYANEHEPAFDLGCCTGLLSVRAVALGRSHCVGIEGNKFDLSRAPKVPNVTYANFFLNTGTIGSFWSLLNSHRPTLIIARRVLPEIHHNNTETLVIIPGMCHKMGVKKIIVQGRVRAKNPKTPLFCVDKEVEVFAKHYRETQRMGQTALLEAI